MRLCLALYLITPPVTDTLRCISSCCTPCGQSSEREGVNKRGAGGSTSRTSPKFTLCSNFTTKGRRDRGSSRTRPGTQVLSLLPPEDPPLPVHRPGAPGPSPHQLFCLFGESPPNRILAATRATATAAAPRSQGMAHLGPENRPSCLPRLLWTLHLRGWDMSGF